MRQWRLPILVSLIVHLLFFMTFGKSGGKGEGDSDQESKGKLVGFKPESILDKNEKPSAPGDLPCPKWFGGIGITTDSSIGRMTVIKAHGGYPAARAGIRKGDVILNDFASIRGKVGTKLTVNVERDGDFLSFTLTRERICTDDGN